MFGWSASHIPLLAILPFLLIASAFFSGSETALFALTHNERMTMRERHPLVAAAVDALLAHPRMLLITILLGNMIVNVLYFVTSSVLLIAATEANWLEQIILAMVSLAAIIIFGEVTPKLLANATRQTLAAIIAPPLLFIHRITTPIRSIINALVIAPLARLTAPAQAPATLDESELRALFETSSAEGVIDEKERAILLEIVALHTRRVSRVMTPRVRIKGIPIQATRQDVIELARETRLTKLPTYERDLDHIVGILHVKRFLLDEKAKIVRGSPAVTKPRFIPELATLDRLLEDFRATHTQIAVVVDEYGGTAGIIAIEDIVREIVGDLWEGDPPPATSAPVAPPGRASSEEGP